MSQDAITFFMPVTDRDVIIADYAVASYQKLRRLPIPFRLLIYPNYLSPALKERHFKKWQQYDYVDIADTRHQDTSPKPSPWEEESPDTAQRFRLGELKSGGRAYKWEGPWERLDLIYDRELRKLHTRYVATVDADFEILNGDFVEYIIQRMAKNTKLKVVSSDYSPTRRYDTNVFDRGYYLLWERYETWFCVYKREVFDFPELHQYREKIDEDSGEVYVWDTSGFFQYRLRQELGYEMECVNDFPNSFIHYSAFSKNRTVGYRNVGIYRALRIAQKGGLLRQALSYNDKRFALLTRIDRRISRMMARRLLPMMFDEAERLEAVYVEARRKKSDGVHP